MKVTIVPIVIGVLGTITKGLLKGLEDLEIGGREGTNTDVKNSKGVNNNDWQKMRTCRTVDFTVPADHSIKLKESETRDK